MKEHIICLTDEARQQLQELVQSGTRSVRVVWRALIRLKSDAGLTDLQIVEHVGCGERTVRNVRKRFCREGLERALYESPRSGRPSDFTRDNDKKWSHWLARLRLKGAHPLDAGVALRACGQAGRRVGDQQERGQLMAKGGPI